MTTKTGLAAATAVLLLTAGAARAGGPDDADRPPYAKPGQCFEKVRTAEVYDTVPERQLVAPERVEHRLIPAEFEMRDRSVVVRPARVDHYPVPATYRTVVETVVVRPASFRTETIPAVYEPVTRQVLVREARTVWKPGYATPAYAQGGYARRGYGQSYGYAPQGYDGDWRGQTQVTPTGEILCLVVEPALYRTVVEQVLRSPERTVEIPVPAVTQQVTRQVVDRPGYDAAREIPAEYGVVREKVLVRPERDESYTVPPVYRTVETRRLVSPARSDWRQIACAVPPQPAPPPPPPPCAERCGPPVVRAPPPPRRDRPARRVHHRYWTRGCDVCAVPPAPDAYAPAQGRPLAPASHMGGHPMVQRLQTALAGRGYYRGPVDGVFNEPTHDALVRFQRDKGLDAQGEMTRESARELGLAR